MFLPSFNNLNINATNINDYQVKVIEGSNFKFEYKTYTINKVQDVPFSMIGVADIINMPSTLHYKFNYPNIDYKELFMNNINSNYADLTLYRKELIYFVEISGNYQDELVFHDPTRTNVNILIDIDGNDNKFGVYLMTLNAKEIIQRYMVVDFTIDNKTYEYNVNLTNFNNTSYEGECSFKCEEFSVEKGSIDEYKLTYSLKMDKDFGIDVYNNLKMNHPIFNGKASVYNQDEEMYVMVGGGYVNLSKNTSYLINIEFEESGSIYYFDEYLPFRICFDFDFSKARYIFPQIESNYHSLVLDKIF